MGQELEVSPRKSVVIDMADRFGMEPIAFEATLRATVIKPDRNGRVPTREEFAAFLLVAKKYNLDPITKEIFAFTDRGGVVPIVSVDGWSRLINSHPQSDGVTFQDHLDDAGNLVAITCNMHRKDRTHPTSVTEYMVECRRDTDTWRRWPRRMLRHKAMIQAARYCFGFAGIYDEDEGERIVEADHRPTPPRPPVPPKPPAPVIEAKANEAANPTPPKPPAPPRPPAAATPADPPKPAVTLEEKLSREVNKALELGDTSMLEAAWDAIVTPHERNIGAEQYQALQAIYREAEAQF